jgi:hypothetical protein
MKKKKLKLLAEEIRSLRRRAGSVHDRELVAVAKKLGRYRIKTDGHPQYGSALRPGRITIPSHSRPLKQRTTLSILDDLDADIFYWKERLSYDNDAIDDSQ